MFIAFIVFVAFFFPVDFYFQTKTLGVEFQDKFEV